jgi:hypothetical protein
MGSAIRSFVVFLACFAWRALPSSLLHTGTLPGGPTPALPFTNNPFNELSVNTSPGEFK